MNGIPATIATPRGEFALAARRWPVLSHCVECHGRIGEHVQCYAQGRKPLCLECAKPPLRIADVANSILAAQEDLRKAEYRAATIYAHVRGKTLADVVIDADIVPFRDVPTAAAYLRSGEQWLQRVEEVRGPHGEIVVAGDGQWSLVTGSLAIDPRVRLDCGDFGDVLVVEDVIGADPAVEIITPSGVAALVGGRNANVPCRWCRGTIRAGAPHYEGDDCGEIHAGCARAMREDGLARLAEGVVLRTGERLPADVLAVVANALWHTPSDHADNLAVERAEMPAVGWPVPSAAYEAQKESGCCGRSDTPFRAADGSTWFLGYNYGH